MENIRCTVERITYQNEENGWSVLRVNVKGYKDVVTLVGNFCDTKVGAVLAVEGNWRMDAKFGKQFQAVNWKEELPSSIVGIEKYLGSGLIKGIGSVYAKKIVAKFGEETLNIIEEDIQRLSEVDGIGKKRIDLIAKSWEKQKDVKDIMVFLQGNGVSSAYAAKIYKAYGKESIDKVKENPYRLADDIWGIGFKTADSIAKNMGYAENDIRRCKSGIIYSLNQLANDRHVYATREQLIKDANERLGLAEIAANSQTTVPNTSASSPITEEIPLGMVAEPTPQMRPPVEQALEELISAEELKVEDECIYLPPFYYSEVGVAKKLLELRNAKQDNLFAGQVNMEAIEKESGITYDDVQQAAIHMAAESKDATITIRMYITVTSEPYRMWIWKKTNSWFPLVIRW